MNDSASQWLRLVLGREPERGATVVFFSARLDETGTDGKSQYAIVAGGVSIPVLWDGLEARWSELLKARGVSAYHAKEFNARDGDFAGWSELKRQRFAKSIEKIIVKNVSFRVAVAVHRDTHAEIKKRWRGVRNFKGDSDVGICFRIARYMICEQLAKYYKEGIVQSSPQVAFIVEDGPYAADTATVYQGLVASGGGAKYGRPSYTEMLAGFATAPKGQLRSLEAADHIAGCSIAALRGHSFRPLQNQVSKVLTPEFLEQWNRDMQVERGRRQAHGRRAKGDRVSGV